MLKFFNSNTKYLVILFFCQALFTFCVMNFANQGYSGKSTLSAKMQESSEGLKVMAVNMFGRTTTHWKIQQLEKEASTGNLNAQVELAELYFRGDKVDRNLDNSLKWFSKAAAQGDSYSQKMIRVINNDRFRNGVKT